MVHTGETASKEKVPIGLHIKSLQQTAWLPAPTSSIHMCMPWPAQAQVKSCTVTPLSSRPLADAWLCSADFRIVTETVSNPELRSRILKWSEEIPVNSIARQLRAMSECYQKAKEEDSVDFDSDSLQEVRETITGLIPQLYQRLNNRLSSSESDVTKDVKAILWGQRWIWVGDSFVAAEEVALTSSQHTQYWKVTVLLGC